MNVVRRALRRVATQAAVLRSRSQRADVSFFFDFVPPPYGGGNQFLHALRAEFSRRGYRVEANTISPTTRACLYNSFNFDPDRLRAFRRDGCRLVHRVDGPVSVYRGHDDGSDGRVADLNREFAAATIVQSHYSLERQRSLGHSFVAPRVIHNASDPAIFHARGRASFARGRKVRLISTSWSANVNKGATVYQAIEGMLDWDRFDYTFVGRSPVQFERIRVIPPQPSAALADLLRAHDVFVTASLHDPCSNALVEALSCGLPTLYVQSGGHAELVGAGGLGFSGAEDVPALLDRLVADYDAFQARIEAPRLDAVADAYLDAMGLGRA